MNLFKKILLTAFVILATVSLEAQTKSFEVRQTAFSSALNDEFAPAFYKNGLVFSSNALSNASIKSEGGRLFNIVYAPLKDSNSFKSPELFSKELTTILNEGPVSFSADEKTIFYARNILIEGKFKDINSPTNTMGIYIAQLNNGVWSNIQAFPYNSEAFSIGTPAYCSATNRLYFASDMKGGKGGTDIYYSELKNGEWQNPVNLGAIINTPKNEAYPFAAADGKLFFASDGHGGYGGKDIFYTVEMNAQWQQPIHLEGDINSAMDDYGIVTDVNFEKGYFSSNRKHSTSVYAFESMVPQFGYCDTVNLKMQCFRFFDERFTDTLHLEYEWNFGRGIVKKGYSVEHCYDKPGDYDVLLTITHRLADSVFQRKVTHRFTIEPPADLSFEVSSILVAGEPFVLEGANAGFDKFEISESYWNVGDGYVEGNMQAECSFDEPGLKNIYWGLGGPKDSCGRILRTCVMRQIEVLEDYQVLAGRYLKRAEEESEVNIARSAQFVSAKDNVQYGIFCSVLTESLSMIDVDRIESFVGRRPGWRIDFNEGQITDESRVFISEIGKMLFEVDGVQLHIAVHKGIKGNAKDNLHETEMLASEVKAALVIAGIKEEKIAVKGFGSQRPLFEGKDKVANALNQRVEFIVIDAKNENGN